MVMRFGIIRFLELLSMQQLASAWLPGDERGAPDDVSQQAPIITRVR
jgi:hypothetical protein